MPTTDLIVQKTSTKCWMGKSPKGCLAPYYTAYQRKGVWDFMTWNTSRTKAELKKAGWQVVKCEAREV